MKQRTGKLFWALALVLTVGKTASVTAGETNRAPLQLVVSLTDGSRVIGKTTVTDVLLRSEALGKLAIPLEKLRTVKFSPNHETVMVSLANGDTLQGSLGTVSVKLQTLFGLVTVPLEQTLEISVVPRLAGALSDGLIAYFPFAGNAEDHSGNGHTGQVVGASFQRDEDTGMTVLQVQGNGSSYVMVPRAAALEPVNGITISMWVKGQPGQAAGSGWGVLLRKANHCQAGYFIRGGGVSAFQLEGTTPCATASYAASAGFREFNPTKWQHIVATYSRADGWLATYQDGELIHQQALTQPLMHSGDLYLGGAPVAGDDGGFRGRIADVRIYNRGLSAADVRALSSRGLTAR